MTTVALTPSPTARRAPSPTQPVTFRRIVAAEWIKFRTVRSTVWTLVATVVLMVGVAALLAWASTLPVEGQDPVTQMNIAQLLSAGYQLGQLAIAVLAVLTVTSEYSTGMIRSTFAAEPRRWPALAAKAVVLSLVVAGVTVVSMALAYLATMPFHATLGATFDLGDAETQRMVVGLPLYLIAIALLSFGLGALLRHSAAALTVMVGLLLVVENVLMMVPLRAFELISPILPSTAGRKLLFDTEMLAAVDSMTKGPILTPWEGYLVLLAWVAVIAAAAVILLRRRDA